MDRKAALCCTFSILLASCGGGGGGGSGDLSGNGGGTSPPSSTDGEIPSGLIQATDGNFYGTTSGGGQHGVGTIFRLTPAGVETVLYSFAGGTADGEYPEGLIQGQDGNFYGTTNDGGVNACTRASSGGASTSGTGCGVVFKVTPSGQESVVYFFKGGADGGEPNPGLVQASDGTLYGTSQSGGLQGTTCGVGCGNVFRITTAGAESAVYNFTGSGGDGSIPTSVIVGTNGNLYGTTYIGGQSDYGTIFELTVGGAESQLYSFQGKADGAQPSSALTEGTDGNIYGTEPFGGSGRGTIFEVAPTGGITTLYSFNGSPNDGAGPGPLVSGTGGHFYGVTAGGGVATCSDGCGTVFEFTVGVGETTVFQFPAVASGSSVGSPIPYALIQGTDGNLYGTTATDGTYGFGTVYRMTATGSKSVVYSFGAPAQ